MIGHLRGNTRSSRESLPRRQRETREGLAEREEGRGRREEREREREKERERERRDGGERRERERERERTGERRERGEEERIRERERGEGREERTTILRGQTILDEPALRDTRSTGRGAAGCRRRRRRSGRAPRRGDEAVLESKMKGPTSER